MRCIRNPIAQCNPMLFDPLIIRNPRTHSDVRR